MSSGGFTREEAWEAFLAWYSEERARFAFYPPRDLWKKRSAKFGIPEADFDRWADQRYWYAGPK